MHCGYSSRMSRVIQVRGLADETHDALVRAAGARGMSLSQYLRGELEAIARRAEVSRRNLEVVRVTQSAVGTTVSRDDILSALTAGRRE